MKLSTTNSNKRIWQNARSGGRPQTKALHPTTPPIPLKRGLFPAGKRRNIGLVSDTVSASSFSCFADRQERRPGLPACHRSSRSRGAFRKITCSAERAHWPINTPVPPKSRTTTLGPFGEVIRATGPMAKVNPMRFSTKYQDDESDLLYYGYRYYKPSTGTWVSRDPLGEIAFKLIKAKNREPIPDKAGVDWYTFCRNQPTDKIDLFGMEDCSNPCAGMQRGSAEMGTIVCCGGNQYVCVFGPPFPGVSNAKAASIIAECLYVHEALHTLDTKPCKKCGKYPAELKRGSHEQSECTALTGELSCLETSLDECNGDEDCRLAVMGWANNAYRQAAGLRGPDTGYCKNPPPPPPWWK